MVEERITNPGLFAKVFSVATSVGFGAALLWPLAFPEYSKLSRPAPTFQNNFRSSYEQCLQYDDKELRRELPIGTYSCQEVEDLYLKVKE